jgi:hypothetical protein
MRSSKAECDVDEVGHFWPPFPGFYVAVLQRFYVEPLLTQIQLLQLAVQQTFPSLHGSE